jgi:hypothetical protein
MYQHQKPKKYCSTKILAALEARTEFCTAVLSPTLLLNIPQRKVPVAKNKNTTVQKSCSLEKTTHLCFHFFQSCPKLCRLILVRRCLEGETHLRGVYYSVPEQNQ